jgi:Amt family ammonium transporter
MALTVTHISAAAASLTWALWEKLQHGKASLVGMVTGTIAGLASITPASGSVDPVQALIIGAIAGVLCQILCGVVKNTLNIDDTLDVFAVHGVGGMFGILMLVVFGHAGATEQIGGLIVVGIFTVVMTVIIILVTRLITPIRVDEEVEAMGLDLTAHGERAYDMTS